MTERKEYNDKEKGVDMTKRKEYNDREKVV